MKTVRKYPLMEFSMTEIELPAGAKPLHVEYQHETLNMWVLLDTSAMDGPNEERTFSAIGTGWTVEVDYDKFIGTAVKPGGNLVFHVFETTPVSDE